MASRSETLEAKTAPRKDGRRPFMIYLEPTLIKEIKRRALNEDQHAYEIVERILLEHIKAP